jgi:hypothetical protein
VTEKQLLAAVVELAGYTGLLVYHTYDSRRSDPGFPDLVLAGGRGVIFAELKTEHGEMSSAQLAWKWRLLAGRSTWRLWRPSHLQSGQILQEMKAIA